MRLKRRQGGQVFILHSPFNSDKNEDLPPMGFIFRQRHQSILVAFGVTNMTPHVFGVNIANGQPDSFAKVQPHTVGGKKKDFVAQPVGCGKQPVELFDGQNIRNPGSFGDLIRGISSQGFVQYPGVKKLQAIQIELDCTPGMALQKFVEIINQLNRMSGRQYGNRNSFRYA